MTMKKLLGISLALVMLLGSVPLGFSEPLKVQLEQGLEADQIQCQNPDHVLVERTNGKLACVTEKGAEKMNWEIISDLVKVDLNEASNEIVKISDKRITVTSETNPTSSSNTEYLIPEWASAFTTLQYPSMVNVGEEFEINTSWQFFELNEDGELDEVIYLEDRNGISLSRNVSFDNDHGQGIEFLTSDGFNLTTYESGPETIGYLYEKEEPFENTLVHNDTLKFKIHQVFDWPFNNIGIYAGQNYEIYITDNQDGTFSLSLDSDNGLSNSELVTQYGKSEKETERYDKVIVDGFRHEEPWTCDEECQKTLETTVDEGPDPSVWHNLADFVELMNPDNVREFLRESNMTELRIDEFLELYPELKTQSFLPSLSFILPQAFGSSHQSNPVFVHGKFMIFGDSGNHISPIGAKVCAVDELNQKGTFAILNYQGKEACRIIDSATGSYGFSTDNIDANGNDNGPADLAVALYLDNDEVVNIRGMTTGTYMQPSEVFEDFTGGTILGFGKVMVFPSNDMHRAFSIFQYIMDANDFLENKFKKNIDKVQVRWQDNGAPRSSNHDNTNYSKLWDRITIGYENDAHPYSTLHEYGHHFMSIIYESNGGTVLPNPASCSSHSMRGVEVPQCAWTEGFAEFFPFMVSEVGQLTSLAIVDPRNVDSATVNYIINMEDRKLVFTTGNLSFPAGLDIEGNIAATLYDIVDGTGEVNTDGNKEKYDDLNSLGSEWFETFDTRPSGETMPQENFEEFKKDWDKLHTEKLDRVMFLNELSPTFTPTGPIVPDDSKYNIFFTEDFESGNLNKWVSTTEDDEFWNIVRPDGFQTNQAIQINNFPSSNNVLISEDCDKKCTLTLKDSIDMTKFKEAKLQIYRLVDGSIETGEGIIIDVSTNGGSTWTNLVSWLSPEFEDNTWHGYNEPEQNLSLDKYLTSQDFKFRIIAKSSSNNEDNQIDNVRLLVKFKSGGGGCSTCPPPPTEDTTGPSITITSPTAGQTITTNSVTVSATASDPSGIQKMKIKENGKSYQTFTGQSSASRTFTGLSEGSHTFKVRAYDDSTRHNRSSQSVTITIDLPEKDTTGPSITITSPTAGQTITTDSLTVSGTATDTSGIKKISIAPQIGNAIVITGGQSSFSHTFTGLTDGSHTFTVTAWDDSTKQNRSSKSVTITIDLPDLQVPPVLDKIPNITLDERQLVTFDVFAKDANNDPIKLSITNPYDEAYYSDNYLSYPGNQPYVTIHDNGNGKGTVKINLPTEVHLTSYDVTVTATANGDSVTEKFTINITELNKLPILGTIANQSADSGETISFVVTAKDRDRPSQTLTYSISNNPIESSFNSSTGEFTWILTDSQIGTHSITFTVTDSMGGTDSQIVSFEIPRSGPTVPVFTTESKIVDIGGSWIGGVSDPNVTVTLYNNDNFLWKLSPQNTKSGTWGWDTRQLVEGDNVITATATDSRGTSHLSEPITLRIIPSNTITLHVDESRLFGNGIMAVDWKDEPFVIAFYSHDVNGAWPTQYVGEVEIETFNISGGFDFTLTVAPEKIQYLSSGYKLIFYTVDFDKIYSVYVLPIILNETHISELESHVTSFEDKNTFLENKIAKKQGQLGYKTDEKYLERLNLQIVSLETVINLNEKMNKFFKAEINNHSDNAVLDTHLVTTSNISFDCNNIPNPDRATEKPTGDFLNKNQFYRFLGIMCSFDEQIKTLDTEILTQSDDDIKKSKVLQSIYVKQIDLIQEKLDKIPVYIP